jgi:hypothetical protein
MPLTKLTFKAGVNRETTSYSNEGGWFDCDKIRFRSGVPEKIGGWFKNSNKSFYGIARALHSFVALDNSRYLGTGTTAKYYINEGGDYNDVTPLRATVASGGTVFAAIKNALSAGVTATVDVLPISSSTNFPPSGRVQINSEEITYAGVSGNTLIGCVRGVSGTTAAAHDSGDDVLCATIKATCSAGHGAVEGDFVTFSDAATLGGNVTANVLNQEYAIQQVTSTTVFHFEVRAASTTISSILVDGIITPSHVFANASDSGNGGGSIVAAFQVSVGLDTVVEGTGWGAGTWGRGTWDSSASTSASTGQLRFWTHDNFGEDLLINIRDGGIFYWDKSNGVSTRAVALSALAGADTGTPTLAKKVIVSDRDRHILVFGCDPQTAVGTQDPLLIRFSSQESSTTWDALATNTAGDLRVGSGSEIITALETRQQILVFTDVSLHAMQYLGPPFTFGISLISENITIMGPETAKASDDLVFWMGLEDFYVYDGRVRTLPCTLKSYVFNDFNLSQKNKAFAALNSSFNEVWWFYPSASSAENDRYVIYNYVENAWAYGNLNRTAWIDRGINDYPISASTDYYLYDHELGLDDGSTSPSQAISAHIESSQVDLSDGDKFVFMRRVIPDLTFDGSTSGAPTANVVLKTRNFPGGEYLHSESSAVTRSTTVPVEQFTNQAHIRLRGRSFALRVESSDTEVQWRLGAPRVDIRPDGRR